MGRYRGIAGWTDTRLVLEWHGLEELKATDMRTCGHIRQRQTGFTFVELLIAGVILMVGLLAVTALFGTAVGNNGRSRIDSTATMLSQSVIEQITAVLARGGPAQITDCKGTVFNINTAAGGAQLNGSSIDFTQATPPDGYWMKSGSQTGFTVCDGGGGESGTQASYDVRWNISAVSQSFLVTVSARPLGNGPKRFSFSLPITLRAYVGSE
jgi:type II secretory pathway pseudopilin PulG